MVKKIKLILSIFLFINFFNLLSAEENFFDEAKNKFNEKKLEDSKFLFQRNIVFNPKDAESYLYLAKIYNFEENEKEEEKIVNGMWSNIGRTFAEYPFLKDFKFNKTNFDHIKINGANYLDEIKKITN